MLIVAVHEECAQFVKVVKGGSRVRSVCVCVFAEHRQRERVIFCIREERHFVVLCVCACVCFVMVCVRACFWSGCGTHAVCHLVMNDVQKLNEICFVGKAHAHVSACRVDYVGCSGL